MTPEEPLSDDDMTTTPSDDPVGGLVGDVAVGAVGVTDDVDGDASDSDGSDSDGSDSDGSDGDASDNVDGDAS